MNIFLRILLAVYAFCLVIVSAVTMLVTLKPVIFKSISAYISDVILQKRGVSLIMFATALVFLILSCIFLLSGIRSSKDKKAISRFTNIGEIKISINSIESIALAASRKLIGIRDTRASVKKNEDSVSICIKAIVLSDINIPSLSEDIQKKVKGFVEDITGVKVDNVKVMIDNIYASHKSKVE